MTSPLHNLAIVNAILDFSTTRTSSYNALSGNLDYCSMLFNWIEIHLKLNLLSKC